jgi:hypothetical protein
MILDAVPLPRTDLLTHSGVASPTRELRNALHSPNFIGIITQSSVEAQNGTFENHLDWSCCSRDTVGWDGGQIVAQT